MIRNNDATELCITKGQEAYVVGWDATEGSQGQNILETLYLELKNPPKNIQLPYLPENVVPISKTSKSIKCILPYLQYFTIYGMKIRQIIKVILRIGLIIYKFYIQNLIYCIPNNVHLKLFKINWEKY